MNISLSEYDPFDTDNPQRRLCGHLVEDGAQPGAGCSWCGEDE